MSAALPDLVDVWRLVQAGRSFQGSLPIDSMQRLKGSLAESDATEPARAQFALEFGRDDLGIAYVDVSVEVGLPMICQRTLDTFVQPVTVDTRLGLITDEAEEAGLPTGYEPLLVPEGGQMHLADVIEDELILALPVIPVKPGTVEHDVLDPEIEDEELDETPNPFAALGRLKKN